MKISNGPIWIVLLFFTLWFILLAREVDLNRRKTQAFIRWNEAEIQRIWEDHSNRMARINRLFPVPQPAPTNDFPRDYFSKTEPVLEFSTNNRYYIDLTPDEVKEFIKWKKGKAPLTNQ